MLNNQKEKDADRGRAYNAALRLLTSREHSQRELFSKLGRKFSRDAALEAVKRCAEEGWQSDERYAEMLLRHMELKLYGPVKFRQEALKKGLREELLTPFIESTDWLSLALEALKHRYQRDELDFAARQKALAMLYRRGFTSAECTQAMTLFLNENKSF